MSYYLLCILLVGASFHTQGQTATEEALNKACACYASVDFTTVPYSRLSYFSDSCLQVALYTNLTGVLSENKIDLNNSTSMLKLANSIADKMTNNCPDFQTYSLRLAQKKVAQIRVKYPSVRGLMYALDTKGQFPVLYLISEDNQQEVFYWLGEFDGSSRFMNGLKPYRQQLVEVYWKDVAWYNKTQKQYINYKEIVLIEEGQQLDTKDYNKWIDEFESKK